ncbi:hypothetical protein JCM19238_1152 [Vibrio ponticus]|nr:hypothetical protein JCM19238_1152 [Vibrio ponticus]
MRRFGFSAEVALHLSLLQHPILNSPQIGFRNTTQEHHFM